MPTLPTQIIRDFAKKARHIKIVRSVMPITDFIKVEFLPGIIRFTKTNIRNFVCTEYQHLHTDTGTFLMEEKELFNFANGTPQPEITFTFIANDKGGGVVHLRAKELKFKFPSEPVSAFPNTPAHTNGGNPLDATTIQTLQEAALFTGTDELRPWVTHVHVQRKGVYASDTFMMYRNSTPMEFQAFFNAQDLQVLQGVTAATFHTSDNYTIFEIGDTTYYFQQIDSVKAPDFDSVIPRGEPACTVTVASDFVTSFCNMVIAQGEAAASVRVTAANGLLSVRNHYVDFGKEKEDSCEAVVKGEVEDFGMNPAFFKVLLSVVDTEPAMEFHKSSIVMHRDAITVMCMALL